MSGLRRMAGGVVGFVRPAFAALALAAVVASALVARSAHATTDPEFCAMLVPAQEDVNRDIGRQSDEVTINRGMFTFCAMRVVIFRKEITVPSTAFRPGWQDRRKVQWNRTMCEEQVWAQMIGAGWKVTVEAVFADGVRYSSQADCGGPQRPTQ